jgi:hypothetical protein
MKKIISSLIIFLILPNYLFASEDGSGTYFGLAGGYSTYNAGFFANHYVIEDDTGITFTKSFSESATGFKVYGGYQFNKIVAVEAAYTEYGEFNAKNYSQDPNSFSVYANLGYNFLNGQLRPFGMVGLGYLKSFQSHDLLEQDFVTFHGGAGIEYSPTIFKGVGFRASVDWDINTKFQNGVDDSNNQVDSILFFQRYSLWSLAIQYKF